MLFIKFIKKLFKKNKDADRRCDFTCFKSGVGHHLKRSGDIGFILDTLQSDDIMYYYEKEWYPECMYLLAMLDYISRINDVPLCDKYDFLRNKKLSEIIYPTDILLQCYILKTDEPKEEALREAIPEFLRFNIVESDIRNVG